MLLLNDTLFKFSLEKCLTENWLCHLGNQFLWVVEIQIFIQKKMNQVLQKISILVAVIYVKLLLDVIPLIASLQATLKKDYHLESSSNILVWNRKRSAVPIFSSGRENWRGLKHLLPHCLLLYQQFRNRLQLVYHGFIPKHCL